MMTNEEMNLMYQLWNENLKLKTNNYKDHLALWKFKDADLLSARYYCTKCSHVTEVWCERLPLKCDACDSPMINYEFYKRLHKVNKFIDLTRLRVNNDAVKDIFDLEE